MRLFHHRGKKDLATLHGSERELDVFPTYTEGRGKKDIYKTPEKEGDSFSLSRLTINSS